tara:strand:+ start:714 stop:1037 length:324 start_codon:yes stop_codon:yes gene_type:complete
MKDYFKGREDNIKNLIAFLTYSLKDRGFISFRDSTNTLIVELMVLLKADLKVEVEFCISAEGYFLDTSTNSMLVLSCHAESIRDYYALNNRPCTIEKEGSKSRLIFT